MRCDVARLEWPQQIVIDSPPMNVIGEKLIPIRLGKLITQINHCAAMGMSTAGSVLLLTAQSIADIPQADEVQMVRDCVDPLVGKLAAFATSPRLVVRSLNHLEQMRIDAVADECIPIVIPVDPPGIRRPVGERLPNVSCRMVTPDPPVETLAF